MSKFLTPPVWYDSNGNLVEILAKAKSSEGVGVGPELTIPGAGVGVDANAGYASVAIGTEASANRLSVAIGYEAKDSSSGGGISIGASSTVAGEYSVSIGNGANTPNSYSISIGAGATATAQRSVVIGPPLIIEEESIPTTAVADAVAIGCGASAQSSGIAIGEASESGDYGISIGESANGKSESIVIGSRSTSNAPYKEGEMDIIVGTGSSTNTGRKNIVIGHNSKAAAGTNGNNIIIGNGINLQTPGNLIQIGDTNTTYKAQIGNGLNTTLKCTAERATKSSFADSATKWSALSDTQWINSSVDSSGKYYFAEITGTAQWYQVMLTNSGVAYTDGVDFCSTILQFQGTGTRTGKQLIAVVVPRNISSNIYYYFAAIDNSNRDPSGNIISRIEVTRYCPAIGTATQSEPETIYVPFRYRGLK